MTRPLVLDISYHQTATPSLASISAVIVRATYGNGTDSMYATHAANVLAAGLPLGAYAFGRSVVDVTSQVDAFLAAAKGATLLALDVELDGHPRSLPDPAMTHQQATQFIAAVHHRDSRPIGLYHSESGYFDAGQDFNWVANWSAKPSIPWTLWQYGSFHGEDASYFNGDAAGLAKLFGRGQSGGTNQPEDPMYVIPFAKPLPFVVTGSARSFAATDPYTELEAVSGTVSVDATVILTDATKVPHGSFVRVVTGATGRRLVAAASVTPAPEFSQADVDNAKAAGFEAAVQKGVAALEAIKP